MKIKLSKFIAEIASSINIIRSERVGPPTVFHVRAEIGKKERKTAASLCLVELGLDRGKRDQMLNNGIKEARDAII